MNTLSYEVNFSLQDNATANFSSIPGDGIANKHSLTYYVLSVTTNCIVSLFILVNNSLILITLIKTEKLHTLPNAYVASLTVADFLLGILLIVRNFWLLPNTEWFFNENKFVCMPFICLLYINGLESIFCLVLVSFDRYMYIVHPYWYKRNVGIRVVGVLILMSWLFSVPFGCLPLWLNDFTQEKGCNPMQILSHHYLIGLLVFFIICAISIAFMYGRIYNIMRHQRRKSYLQIMHAQNSAATNLSTTSTKNVPKRQLSSVHNRWQVIRFLIFVCAMFFICWIPAVIALPLQILGITDLPVIVVTITVSMAALNSACNMFAFIVMNPDFRHALMARFWCRKTPKPSREPNVRTFTVDNCDNSTCKSNSRGDGFYNDGGGDTAVEFSGCARMYRSHGGGHNRKD